MIEPADLVWRDGQPYSPAFADIYHHQDGVGEVERVFLAPGGFDELLTQGRPLVLGELGFGTGLNFAVAARKSLAAGVRLHFISLEAAPIAPAAFHQLALSRRREEPVYTELSAAYPPLVPGWHRRSIAAGRIQLSLFWGEAAIGLRSLVERQQQPVDLWLLDGFAPDRNPEMWTETLLQGIGQTAGRRCRVTTFTAAGRVRRRLMAAGFDMRRVDQQPHKRESLAGTFTGSGRPERPWPDQVTVVGAGIAGAAVARTLAESGIKVAVVEAADEPATGASSIPATVMHPRLHHDGSDLADFKATAYAHALAATRQYADAAGSGISRTGALQVPSSSFPADRLEAVAERYRHSGLDVHLISAVEARNLAGDASFHLHTPVLWFPQACLVDTPAFTRTLLDHANIDLRRSVTLAHWPQGPVVLACGHACRNFPGAGYLELGTVHGQLDLVTATAGPLAKLRLPITGNGYVTPMDTARPLFAAGATYEYEPWPEAQASAANHRHLQRLAGAGFEPHGSRKARRCVSSDRNPVIGRLYPLAEKPLPEDRPPAMKSAATAAPAAAAANDRLVSVGHGSMGTVSSHIAAALIDAILTHQFEPLSEQALALVSAQRFRTRQARRGYRFGAVP